ncbi:hypothetical protein BKN38_08890 [Helicobacter sp. CLO-3]|uniref:hypothetical protein n=1 Tax=unclassified Helicobacter TaxID=2593540 RepID=UPI00080560B7|nr:MULTISPECIES: hypothetical protein [unclassified Helicobacter]OBV28852.1 hypothetical protein BA723_07935 [Helicobacter sp. CLO-3]OHU81480.1 hypothetical protein BKN38_08890 [Helicobacter sp. CLO-3]
MEQNPQIERNFIELSKRAHFIGSRTGIFEEDCTDRLDFYMQNAGVKTAVTPANHELFTPSCALIYPDDRANDGFEFIIASCESEAIINTIFGFVRSAGLEYRGKLSRVNVWDKGAVAQLELDFDFGDVIFFDENFIAKREHYTQDMECAARIYLLAYGAENHKDKIVELEVTEANKEMFPESQIGDVQQLHTGEMRAFVGDLEGGDIDEYELIGKINAIRKIRLETFGKEAYICTIDAFHDGFDEHILDFEVVIMEDVWREKDPPQMDAFIWAKGYFGGEIVSV